MHCLLFLWPFIACHQITAFTHLDTHSCRSGFRNKSYLWISRSLAKLAQQAGMSFHSQGHAKKSLWHLWPSSSGAELSVFHAPGQIPRHVTNWSLFLVLLPPICLTDWINVSGCTSPVFWLPCLLFNHGTNFTRQNWRKRLWPLPERKITGR